MGDAVKHQNMGELSELHFRARGGFPPTQYKQAEYGAGSQVPPSIAYAQQAKMAPPPAAPGFGIETPQDNIAAYDILPANARRFSITRVMELGLGSSQTNSARGAAFEVPAGSVYLLRGVTVELIGENSGGSPSSGASVPYFKDGLKFQLATEGALSPHTEALIFGVKQTVELYAPVNENKKIESLLSGIFGNTEGVRVAVTYFGDALPATGMPASMVPTTIGVRADG